MQRPSFRVFSFFIPEGDGPRFTETILELVGVLADEAVSAGLLLLHENEKDIYGDLPGAASISFPALLPALGRRGTLHFVHAALRQPFTQGYRTVAALRRVRHVKDA